MSRRGSGRITPSIAGLLAALCAAGLVLPAAGEEFNPLGDGSEVTNPDLLRDPTTGCENCEPFPPHEWEEPPFDIDWRLSLRGSYVQGATSSYFEAKAVPSVTLRRETLRGGYQFGAEAEISRSTIEDFRIGAARASFEADYQLDEVTAITGNLNLALTQDSAAAPGTSPTIAIKPQVISGDGELAASHDIGQFVVSGRGNASRTVYGPTTLVDSSLVDNTHQNNWTVGGGLRLGYRVTPIVTAFVDGNIGYQRYDAISPTYLVKLDAADYEGRAGLSAMWNELLEAEASVGYGLRRFDEAALGEAGSLLFDASVTFRPDETLELKGSFTTGFGAPGPDSGGTARLEYAAVGDVAYRVNPWLTLRASAGWSRAELIGTTTIENGINAGLGADYVLNEFTTINADYGFERSETTPDPAQDSHTVTVGITVAR